MLTLGSGEIAVIVILAMVLFGPKKLPELARTIGKAMTEFARAKNDLRATFEREMHTLDQETKSLQKMAQDTAKELEDHSSYNYGLPSAQEIWDPDHQERATSHPSAQELAALAAPEEAGTEGLHHMDTPALPAEIAAEHPAEPAAETVPQIIAASEGTVARGSVIVKETEDVGQVPEPSQRG